MGVWVGVSGGREGQRCHRQFRCCDECDRHSGPLVCACASKADAASGAAPDFLLRVPVQSILLCAALKNKRPFMSATGNSGRD